MSSPFIGEIRMFGGNFAPQNWAMCDGTLLNTSQNNALFALLGSVYGGDGRTTFGLPDMRGRAPMHAGSGSGLSQRNLGQHFGSENGTLTTSNLPTHTHTVRASSDTTHTPHPANALLAATVPGFEVYHTPTSLTSMNTLAVDNTGGATTVSNLQSYQVI
ncbi:MAG: tail fiber protein [Candidatus Tectomicrobia bacterium]|nr:tail fiber protein [Candidatus Tectomicrobia bacterium]